MKKKNKILIYSLSSLIVLTGIIGAVIVWLNISGIETLDVTSITSTTAKCGGKVTSKGKFDRFSRTRYGLCWDTAAYPGINNNTLYCSLNNILFSGTLTNLELNTLYHVRAFATNWLRTSYGQDKTFTTSDFLTDFDGNKYATVKIGDQTWMAENLKVTHYRTGDPISNVTDGSKWRSLYTGAYCNYENNINNSTIYGRLYNWYAVTDSHNIAPTGWHVPTEQDWDSLEFYLLNHGFAFENGDPHDIGKSLASTSGWDTCNIACSVGNDQVSNNKSGFTALPGGYRSGEYVEVGISSNWWSSTKITYEEANCRNLNCKNKGFPGYNNYMHWGLSVRLIKD